jgi:regulator of replication initiation timing
MSYIDNKHSLIREIQILELENELLRKQIKQLQNELLDSTEPKIGQKPIQRPKTREQDN